MQGEVMRDYGLEWDRVLLTTLSVANKRLYELRLQTAKVRAQQLLAAAGAAAIGAAAAVTCSLQGVQVAAAALEAAREQPTYDIVLCTESTVLHCIALYLQDTYEGSKPTLDAIRASFAVNEVEV
jgi:hypothetical protein